VKEVLQVNTSTSRRIILSYTEVPA